MMMIQMDNNDGDNEEGDIYDGFHCHWNKGRHKGEHQGSSWVIDINDDDEGGGEDNHNVGDKDWWQRFQCGMNEKKLGGSLPERWLTDRLPPPQTATAMKISVGLDEQLPTVMSLCQADVEVFCFLKTICISILEPCLKLHFCKIFELESQGHGVESRLHCDCDGKYFEFRFTH